MALVLVVPVVVAALVWGRRAAIAVAVVATLAFDVIFIAPERSVRVRAAEDAVALGVLALVALVVGTLVAREGHRRHWAEARVTELQQVNDELAAVEREREQLALDATRAAVLERVDEQRGALLRSVSHDLRTPLATIRAVASDLRSGVIYDEATRDELLDLVGDEAERLDRLVANLLSLSRIEAGALKPDRGAVDLDDLVNERVRRLSRLFLQVRITVDMPPDLPLVDADHTQLQQVVTNLLENAARHAPPKSAVTVTARRAGADRVALLVRDEGAGVAEHERKRVFEPFRRGEGSRSSGIGLAICRAVVDAHGGTIEVERTPGGGATFVVGLPMWDGEQ